MNRDLCDGKDKEIYCKSCYARKYGAPGYRGKMREASISHKNTSKNIKFEFAPGAGCGDWTDKDSAETLRPVQNIDVAKIKGAEGDPDTW